MKKSAVALSTASLLLATGLSLAWVQRDAFLVRYDRLHEDRPVAAAVEGVREGHWHGDVFHHHSGHTHAGAMRSLGRAELSGSELTAFQVGELHEGLGTFIVRAEAHELLPGGVRAWIGTAADTTPPAATPEIAPAALVPANHFHLPVPETTAREALFLHIALANEATARVTFELK